VNGIIEVAGPQQFHLDELVRKTLRERHDPREVVIDPRAPYYGAELHERTLIPAAGARLAETRFDDWLNQSAIGGSQLHRPERARRCSRPAPAECGLLGPAATAG
jgi:hypothetical protein